MQEGITMSSNIEAVVQQSMKMSLACCEPQKLFNQLFALHLLFHLLPVIQGETLQDVANKLL